jgi:hypothetical protein
MSLQTMLAALTVLIVGFVLVRGPAELRAFFGVGLGAIAAVGVIVMALALIV